MKIHFKQTLRADRVVFNAGYDYEVETADAIRYLDAGVARKSLEPVDVALPQVVGQVSTLTAAETVNPADTSGATDAKPVNPEPENGDPANNPVGYLHGQPTAGAHVIEKGGSGATTSAGAGTAKPAAKK